MANAATHRRIAVVLEELSQDIEALGGMLCSDIGFAMRHMDTLQAIDLIAQKQRSLAALLAADCPADAVQHIAIDVLREKLGAID